MEQKTITKGTRVEVTWFQVIDPIPSLSGVQMKVGVRSHTYSGVVRHVRGDAPTVESSKNIALWVEPDSGCETPTPVWCEKCQCQEVAGVSVSSVRVI